MRLTDLSIEAWMTIGTVIGCAVLMSLRTLADKLHYENTLHHLRLETRRMRQEFIRRMEGPAAGAKRTVVASPVATATTTPASPVASAAPVKAAV
jgi:hypothetical protein